MEAKRTILVVDDLPMFRDLESVFLSRYGRVLTAANGAEALETVRREQPDVVVLDFHLPDIDSETLCQRILSLYPAGKTGIIVEESVQPIVQRRHQTGYCHPCDVDGGPG